MSETVDLRVLFDVLFDAARPGDLVPDPGWPCMVPNGDLTWCCNRAAGHKPGTQHVATAGGTVVAVWTGDVPSPAAPTADVLRSVLDGLRARAAEVAR